MGRFQKQHKELQPVMTFAEIGDEMGISHQAAQQLYSSAIRKMKQRPFALRAFAEVVTSQRQYAVPTGPRWTGNGGRQ